MTSDKEEASKIREKVIEIMKCSEFEYECIPLEKIVKKDFLDLLDTLTSKEETLDILKYEF